MAVLQMSPKELLVVAVGHDLTTALAKTPVLSKISTASFLHISNILINDYLLHTLHKKKNHKQLYFPYTANQWSWSE